jgi:hypothetical protein
MLEGGIVRAALQKAICSLRPHGLPRGCGTVRSHNDGIVMAARCASSIKNL